MKNEVIIQKAHRYGYDQAIAVLRRSFRRSGNAGAIIDAAFNDNTVMAHFFNAAEQGRDQPRGLDPRGARA